MSTELINVDGGGKFHLLTFTVRSSEYNNRAVRKSVFANAKKKMQISCAVSAQLISAFVFAAKVVQFLYFLNPECRAFSHLLWLYSPVCV